MQTPRTSWKITFNRKYFLLAVLFFMVEVLIALYVHDDFVRPYVGDYLVVFLIYFAVRTILEGPALKIAAGVLLFAYTVEVLQYFHFVERIGLGHNQLARTVIGMGFEWWDMLAYTLGVGTVVVWEKKFGAQN